jgi:hypothetical protein
MTFFMVSEMKLLEIFLPCLSQEKDTHRLNLQLCLSSKLESAMRGIIVILAMLWFCSCRKGKTTEPPLSSVDSFTVTVHNGYGSGRYKAGDTVHIFSDNYADDQLFDQWSGDASMLNAADEWHTWFIMPDRSVTFTGNIKTIRAFTLEFSQIEGRDRRKPVYYYFPTHAKGIVYLLHGTGGNAAHLVKDYEWQQLIKTLVDGSYAVIITEAEEATLGVDTNGDGKLRWALLPYDTVANVDYANIRILTDTFYHRGLLSLALQKYAIGMSDGGFFSAALSSIYHFQAGINYCSQGSAYIMQHTLSPVQFCMARFDSNPQVGQQGNTDALTNANALNARGVCSKFLIKERCPLYPARFARSGIISSGLSEAIFNEMKSKGFIDASNYFMGYATDFTQASQSSPASFPVFNSLAANQKIFVSAQISLSVSDHRMYSDYDHASLQFLNDPCQ